MLPKVEHAPAPQAFGQDLGRTVGGQDLATGPGAVQLAGGALLPVPRALAVESEGVGLARLIEEPQGARRGQPEAERVSPDDAPALATRILAQAIEGMRITNLDCNGLAVPIRLQHGLHAEGQIRGEEGLNGGGLGRQGDLRRWPGGRRRPPPHQSDWQPRVPQADPALDRGLGFRGRGSQPWTCCAKVLGEPSRGPCRGRGPRRGPAGGVGSA